MTGVTRETEIKLAINDPAQARAHLLNLGFRVAVPQVFERNLVFDTETGTLRGKKHLLRLRQAGDTATLTFKGPAEHGKYKSREERETGVVSFSETQVILERLGYRVIFIYEKYRTEFASESAGVVTLDETPAGNFLEIEGEAEWIDLTAQRLGFLPAHYSTDSYWSIYTKMCAQKGVTPTNMTFHNQSIEAPPTLPQLT